MHHDLLQKAAVLEEPEQLVAELELVMPVVEQGIRDYLRPYLAAERLAPGVTVDEAAEYLSRLFLSYLGTRRPLGPGRPGRGAPAGRHPVPRGRPWRSGERQPGSRAASKKLA
ncbi:MAG: hypothetical protein U5R31_12350 [Acidimicrobiia bacterium]|nr:hypothetical protein [Acidimicrobiia bacterium]